MLPDPITVAAGELAPDPPDGHEWVFARAHRDQRIELIAMPREPGSPDPRVPPGCAFRLVKARGQRVYIPEPQGFAHHPVVPRWSLDD